MLTKRIPSIGQSLRLHSSDAIVTPSEIYAREMQEAKEQSFFGAWDLHLAATLLPASLFLDRLQTEAQHFKVEGVALANNSSLLVNIAQAPVNWKGVGLAGTRLGVNGDILIGTFGVGAAALKIQFERSRSLARGF